MSKDLWIISIGIYLRHVVQESVFHGLGTNRGQPSSIVYISPRASRSSRDRQERSPDSLFCLRTHCDDIPRDLFRQWTLATHHSPRPFEGHVSINRSRQVSSRPQRNTEHRIGALRFDTSASCVAFPRETVDSHAEFGVEVPGRLRMWSAFTNHLQRYTMTTCFHHNQRQYIHCISACSLRWRCYLACSDRPADISRKDVSLQFNDGSKSEFSSIAEMVCSQASR